MKNKSLPFTHIDHNICKALAIENLALPAQEVAPYLLGKILELSHHYVILGEIEAYNALAGDEACHAFRKVTERNKSLSFAAGHLYVYLIYGMHHCANITTGSEGEPQGCLIRGGWVFDKHNNQSSVQYFDGPAKLTKYLHINRTYDGINLYQNNQGLKLWDMGFNPKYQATERIGISKSQSLLWRFVV